MRKYITKDLSFSKEGDFVLDETGDFSISSAEQCLFEDVIIRAKTQQKDWYHFPLLGSNLEDLLGLPRIEKVANMGEQQLMNALTYDGLLTPDEVKIVSVLMENSILYKIYILSSDVVDPINIFLDLDAEIRGV